MNGTHLDRAVEAELDRQRAQYIRKLAEEELTAENLRADIEREKQRLRDRRSFWSRLFPFTITITRRIP